MRKSNFIKKSISLMLAAVMVLALATPMADSKAAQATADNSYDVSEFRKKGSAYTHPTKVGCVFAGWYTDADYKTPLGTDVVEGTAYAKFVSADVLKLKYQLPVNVSETATTTAIRLVTSVDSTDYQYVGFKVEYTENGTTKTREFQTRNVYSIIKGNIDGRVTMKYKPGIFSEASGYLMALVINKLPMSVYNAGLTVTPQWITLDGTTVEGTSRNLKDEAASGTTSTSLSAGLYALDTAEKAVTFVTGKEGYGKALSTNHRNGASAVLSGSNLGTSDFAISTWFKAPSTGSLSTGSGNYLLGICPPDTAGGFSVQIKKVSSTDSTVKLRINTVDGKNVQATVSDYTANAWMHLAVVRSGDTLQVYLNGTAMITDGYALTAGYDFGNPKIAFAAHEGWKNNYHNATIVFDDIRVYGQALTVDEITAIINNTDNTTDEATSTVTYSPAPKAHVTFDNSALANTGTDTAIKANLYKVDEAKKFVKSTKFEATGGVVPYNVTSAVGITTSGKYNEAFLTNHRQEKNGVAAVLDGYNFGTNDFTISFWFMTPDKSKLSTGSQSYLFGIDTPVGNDGFSIQVKRDPALRMKIGSNGQVSKGISLNNNTWYHIALVRSGNVIKVYHNGAQIGSDFSIGDNKDFGKALLAFGSLPGWTTPYTDNQMAYDDIRVYNAALDATDVANIKNNTTLTSTAELKAHVTFDDGVVANTGTDSGVTAGLYKMTANTATDGPNDFVEYNTATGRDGAAFGAIQMKHSEGPYTVLNGFDFGTRDFAVSTWFNVPTSSSNVQEGSGTYLFGICEPDAAEGFAVSMKSGNVRLKLNGATYQPKVTYAKGEWHQVTLTRKGTNVELYFDSTLLGTYSIANNFDFGTKQLAYGGYYGSPNNYHGNTMLFDDMEVTVEELEEPIIQSTKEAVKPVVEIKYTNKTVTNTGTDSSLTVGAYKFDTVPSSTKFVATTASYTTGIEGDANGAIAMRHKSGAYTVVKDYKFGTNDFTISTWFNVPYSASEDVSTTSGTYLFGLDHPDSTERFSIALRADSIRFRVNGKNTIANVSYDLDTWHNLVLTREGDELKLYFNETLLTTVALNTSQDLGTRDLAFGGYYGFKYNYHGNKMYFDNIQVYNEALPKAEISYAVQATRHKQKYLTDGTEMTTLFIGDSFFSSRSYWTNFYSTYYKGKDALCAGIASATTYDWNIFVDSFLAYTNPKNLVVHLGTNDIHSDGDNAATTIQNLQALFGKIHRLENYKDTQIYFFGIPYKKSTMYGDGKTYSEEYKKTVDTVNATMKAWCAEQSWITYIGDLTGGAIADDQFRDNTHLTLDAYSLMTNALAKAGVVIENNGMSFETTVTYRTNTAFTKAANTVSSWIYLPSSYASRGGTIWSNYESDDSACVSYEIDTNGNPRFVHVNEAGQKVDLKFTNVDVRVGSWTNLTFVIEADAKTVSCYLNGTLKQQLVAGYEIQLDTIASVYTLGGDERTDNPEYFKGRILELALYEDTLSADSVKALYTTGLNQTANAPFTYYQLAMEGKGQDISDVVGVRDLIARNRYYTEKDPVTDYAYSFAVIGDPQFITIDDVNNGNQNLAKIYDWILANKDAKNIQHVFNMGDITDYNLPAEWAWAQEQNARMDGVVPYSVVRGNHDIVGYNNQGDTDYFNQYMGTANYKSQFEGFYSADDITNSWRTLTIGETEYLLLTLDWGVAPNNDTTTADKILAWAGDVITSHPNHKVILTTHGFLNLDGTTLDAKEESPPSRAGGTYDGDVLWDKFVSQYENIVLVMSGHIAYEKIVVSQMEGVHGNKVTAMLIDQQNIDGGEGSKGLVTMLYFSKDGKSIEVENFSTVEGKYFLESNQFTIDIAEPEVDIDYTGGTIANVGTNSALTVGAYKLNAANDGFETSTATYTTGMDGEANDAISMTTKDGAYTVVKDYNFGTKDFTISTWFNVPDLSKVAATSSKTYLFGTNEPNATSGFSVCLKQNQLRVRLGTGQDAIQYTPTVSYEANTWNHVALSRKGDTLKLYLNGKLLDKAIISMSANQDLGTADLAFGGYYGFSDGFAETPMYFDNIQVYKTAMTGEHLAAWYTNNKVVKSEVDIAYTGGTIANTGTNSALVVGAYKLNAANDGFATATASYTTGMDGDAKGAISMTPKNGAYTIVNDYNFGTKDFAISTWFNVPDLSKVAATSSKTYLFGTSEPNATSGFSVCLKQDTLRLRLNGTNATMPTLSYEPNTWNHVVLCRESDVLKLYLNGTLVTAITMTSNQDLGTANLAFGGYYGFTDGYADTPMYFDNIHMYGEALTTKQVNNLYLK